MPIIHRNHQGCVCCHESAPVVLTDGVDARFLMIMSWLDQQPCCNTVHVAPQIRSSDQTLENYATTQLSQFRNIKSSTLCEGVCCCITSPAQVDEAARARCWHLHVRGRSFRRGQGSSNRAAAGGRQEPPARAGLGAGVREAAPHWRGNLRRRV